MTDTISHLRKVDQHLFVSPIVVLGISFARIWGKLINLCDVLKRSEPAG